MNTSLIKPGGTLCEAHLTQNWLELLDQQLSQDHHIVQKHQNITTLM